MNAIEIAGTQTAVATAGLPMPTIAGAAAGLPTFTPLAGVNLTPVNNQPTSLPSPTVGAAATAIPALPLATAGPISKPSTYVLHQGEFPYCLARRYNVNPDELLSLNGLSPSQGYYTPGTTLRIPTSGNVFPGPRSLLAHPTQYIARAGDTIYSVACAFGDVDPQQIANANGLSGSSDLTAGATIQIP